MKKLSKCVPQLLLGILTCFLTLNPLFIGTSDAIVNFRTPAQSRPSFAVVGVRGTTASSGSSTSSTPATSSAEFTSEEVQLSRRTSTSERLPENPEQQRLASIVHAPLSALRAPDMEQEFGGSSEGSGVGDPQIMDMAEFQKLMVKKQELVELPKGLELINLHYGVFKDNEVQDGGDGDSWMDESQRNEAISKDILQEQESDSEEGTWKNSK